MLNDALLLLLLLICVITDLRSRRIYNLVLLPALLLTLVLQAVQQGAGGLADAGIGFAAGFAVLLIPYLLGGMGAGDVKLLAVIGAFKGAAFVLTASVYMALAGGVMALIVLLTKRETRERLRGTICSLYALRHGTPMPVAPKNPEAALTAAYPYGLAIAAGAVLCFLLKGWGGL